MLVFVLSSGQLAKSNIVKSIAAFAEALNTDIATIQTKLLPVLADVIDRFKVGVVTEAAFFGELSQQLTALGMELPEDAAQLKNAWNAMCEVELDVLADLRCLAAQQQEHGFKILVIGCTNKSHSDYLDSQLQEIKFQDLSKVYSYKEHSLDPTQLLSIGISKGRLDLPEVELVCFMDKVSVELTAATCRQVTLARTESLSAAVERVLSEVQQRTSLATVSPALTFTKQVDPELPQGAADVIDQHLVTSPPPF